MEFRGDEGSLFLSDGHNSDWHNFDGAVEYAGCGETIRDADTRYERLPYVREPCTGDLAADLHAGVEWSRAVLDMAEAIREGRPPRTTRAQAAHVVDIVTAIPRDVWARSPSGDYVRVPVARGHGSGPHEGGWGSTGGRVRIGVWPDRQRVVQREEPMDLERRSRALIEGVTCPATGQP